MYSLLKNDHVCTITASLFSCVRALVKKWLFFSFKSELHVQQNKELGLFTNVTTDRKRLISVFLQLLELEWNDSAREQFKIFVVFNYKITIITWSVVHGD